MRPLLSYDEIFISPHLDDAALSCGGQIAQATRRGAKVLIVTLFTADAPEGELSPLAAELHGIWGGGANPFPLRREEDRRSCAILGADCEHWGFPDAIYRRQGERWLYASRRGIFGRPDAADETLQADLERRLSALAGLAVRGPMAIGGHVDHRLVRAALEAARLPGLELYEDFPYARSLKLRLLARGFSFDWKSRALPLSAEDLEIKTAAIGAFASQLGPAFAAGHDLGAEIERFARARGGERLYSRRR